MTPSCVAIGQLANQEGLVWAMCYAGCGGGFVLVCSLVC